MNKKICFMLILCAPRVFAGIYEPHTLWDKKELKTCFYTDESQLLLTNVESVENAKRRYDLIPDDVSNRRQRIVKEAILKDFTPERTGIHFTGFVECDKMKDPDVIVMRAKSKIFLLDRPDYNGRAVIGQNGFATIDIENSYFGYYDKRIDKAAHVMIRSFNRGTIVHEFGHVAGLRHGHIYDEAIHDDNCKDPRVNFDSNDETREKLYNTAIMYTRYDPYSIMNYCYLQSHRRYIEREQAYALSPLDAETLNVMYP